MATQENIDSLKERLSQIPDITEEQLNVLTSGTLLTHVMPLMTAFVAENVTQVQQVKDKTGESLRGLADLIGKTSKTPEGFKDFISNMNQGLFDASWLELAADSVTDHWFWGWFAGMIITATHVGTMIHGYISVSSEKTRQTANKDIKPYLLDLATLAEEYFRHPNNYKFVTDQLDRMGLSPDKKEVFLDNLTNLLPLDILRLLWNREEISTNELDDELKKLRYKPEDLDLLRKAFKIMPNMQDFVLFSVREAYDQEFVDIAGLGSNMPPEFIDDMKRIGVKEEYIKYYWYSHWKPPATNQVFEMLHRGVIEMEEVNTLLRINDIMPNYREKLTQIAYNPITRVDIRRLYQDGVTDYQDMYEQYLDTGYAPENAELLAEWTDIHYGEDRRKRTRADILKLYRLGEYDRAQAIDAIKTIGYPSDIANEYVTRSDREYEEKRKNNKLKIWRKGFVNYVFNETEVNSFMILIGMNKMEITDNIEEWKVDRGSKIKFVPLQTIEKLFTNDIINVGEVMDELSIQGYTTSDINRLIDLWSL